MKKYTARELLNWDEDAIWALDNGTNQYIHITFDDGDSVLAPARATIWSWYFWTLHRCYPTMPITMEHHLGNRPLEDGIENQMCSTAMETAIRTVGPNIDMDFTTERLFRGAINAMYNKFSAELEEYHTTSKITDLIELLDYQPIQDANQLAMNDLLTDAALAKCYDTNRNILLNDPELASNAIAILVRQGIVNTKQVLQAICPRGAVQEINSTIFPSAIPENYCEGIQDLASSLEDSRSGTLASVNTTKPLQTSEYTNRKIQLSSMYVTDFADEYDCGTRNAVNFQVTEDSLKHIDGAWRIDEDNFDCRINVTDKHLIGKIIRLRNPATCASSDPAKPCKKCFGDLHHSIPARTNLGWACATELCSGVSQSVLSTKHLNFHAIATLLRILAGDNNHYINNDKKPTEIVLNKDKEKHKKDISLIVPRDTFVNLADVAQVKDIRELSEHKVSEVQELGFVTGEMDEHNQVEWITVGNKDNKSSFTLDFLNYMRNRNYEMIDEIGCMQISLAGWNFDKPIVRQSLRHENSLDFVKRLKYLFEGVDDDRKPNRKANAMGYERLLDCTSASQAVNMAYDVISTKVSLHISMIGVIIRSLTVRDPFTGDYTMTNSNEKFYIGKYVDIMRGRSISAAMAYQEQTRTTFDIDTYTVNAVPHDHPLDWMMMGVGAK